MLEQFDDEYNQAKLVERDEFIATNHLIGSAVLLKQFFKDIESDIQLERFEFETLITSKIPDFADKFTHILDMIYSKTISISAFTIDEFIVDIKMRSIYNLIQKQKRQVKQ